MKKIKLFLSSIDKEEKWINEIQKQGWRLTKVSSWLPVYHFEEKKDQTPPVVRLDFKDYMSRRSYQDYLALYEDCGWKHISGSRWGDFQYFQQTSRESSGEIFSDEESKIKMIKAYYNYAVAYGLIFFIWLVALIGQNHNFWYLDPSVWHISWQATLFALIPLLFINILPPLFLFLTSTYYFTRASRIQITHLRSKKRDI